MLGRRLVPWLVALVGVAALFLGVFPTRTWLAQRDAIATQEARIAVLDQENERLQQRIDELHTEEEIERLAREQYNLVRPGEEAYAILPAPGSPPPTTAPPLPVANVSEPSLVDRVVDALTFWD